MFKAYRQSQQNQLEWIRNHPIQYLALNGAIIAGYFVYVKLADRRDERKFNEQNTND